MKTMRPPAAQWRLVPPCVEGGEPRSVNGAFHSSCALPEATSAVQIAHSCGRAPRTGAGAPPAPGRLTKTSFAPSGDQRGEPSREVVGAIHWMAVESLV